ncbi:MAG: aldo/keto reductase [Verrucomicrobiota bacterium]|nr:aldo/keto reductase [Verrucomicrobiota bacterium]
MSFRPCGRSGLKLSAVSLGAWETFGGYVGAELARGCIFRAFNLGITHFDLANTYGSPVGRAEIIVGRTLREMPREELVVSTKAGFAMWPGPYGEGSSRKALLTSVEQSLARLGLDYVDIFYSHRPDPNTPLEETLRALDQIVREGKALYVGLSNYPAALLTEAGRLARELHLTPITVAQTGYNMLRREMEQEVLQVARQSGLGLVAFSALGQGLLTSRYANGVPESSRAGRTWSPAQREGIGTVRERIRQLGEVAQTRGQTLPQMAIAWTLRFPDVTTALIGASDIDQLEENAKALENLNFSHEELTRIDSILLGNGATGPAQAV